MVFGAYTLVNIWQNNQSCELNPRQLLLRGARPARPGRGRRRDHRRLLRLPLVERLAGPDLHGRHRLARARAARWPASPILTRTEFLLALLGGLFVLQTLSVILQVGYFKVTKGKRLFRMAPLHHHFELLGWEEVTVVIRFWIITGLFVAGGLGVFYAEWVAGT